MQGPKVSIITPSFNQGLFLEETILSVLNQSYAHIEYIVIDGGSSDNSIEIIKKYQHKISYWISEKDGGQASAINKGFKQATGEFICWINSDDLLYPDFVSQRVDQFSGNPQAGLIYGDVEQGTTPAQLVLRKGKQTSFTKMLKSCDVPIPQQSAMWRSSVLKDNWLMDERWHVLLDRVFFMDVALNFKLLYIPGAVAFFRNHSLSKSVAEYARWAQEMPAYYHELFLRSGASYKKYQKQCMTRMYLFCAALYLENNNSAHAQAYLDKARKESNRLFFYYRLADTMIRLLVKAKKILLR